MQFLELWPLAKFHVAMKRTMWRKVVVSDIHVYSEGALFDIGRRTIVANIQLRLKQASNRTPATSLYRLHTGFYSRRRIYSIIILHSLSHK